MYYDYIDLGSTPSEEPCTQLGAGYDPLIACAECQRYINQLRKQFGTEPFGSHFIISSNHHDFGTYYEVVIQFDADDAEQVKWALNVEANLPAKWANSAATAQKERRSND